MRATLLVLLLGVASFFIFFGEWSDWLYFHWLTKCVVGWVPPTAKLWRLRIGIAFDDVKSNRVH